MDSMNTFCQSLRETVMNKANTYWSFEGDSIMNDAIAKWGIDSQILVAIGECGELLAQLGRKAQGRVVIADLVDEIADVTIMMRQLALIYDVDGVEERIRFKLNRLKDRLEA